MENASHVNEQSSEQEIEQNYSPSFVSKHSLHLLIFGIIIFLLIDSSMYFFGVRTIHQKTESKISVIPTMTASPSPTPEISPTETPNPTTAAIRTFVPISVVASPTPTKSGIMGYTFSTTTIDVSVAKGSCANAFSF